MSVVLKLQNLDKERTIYCEWLPVDKTGSQYIYLHHMHYVFRVYKQKTSDPFCLGIFLYLRHKLFIVA